MTLSVQLFTMIWMIISGLYLGIALDTFRRFVKKEQIKTLTEYLLEICFWLLQTLLLFYVLYKVNAGELSMYVFLACLLGFSAYKALFSTIYKRLLERFIHFFVSVFNVSKRVIETIIIIPVKTILQLIFSLILLILRILLTIFHLVLWLLKPFQILVRFCYHRLPETYQQNIYKIITKFSRFYSILRSTCIKCLDHITFKRRK